MTGVIAINPSSSASLIPNTDVEHGVKHSLVKSNDPEHGRIKRRRINENDVTASPQSVLLSLIKEQGYKDKTLSSLSQDTFFEIPTQEQIDCFNFEIVKVVREGDVEKLRKMHKNGRILQCCNKFGESIIHMACRRSLTDVVVFLADEAGVSLRVRDDFGRTPLHDAFWTGEPNLCLIEYLLKKEPDIMLMKDRRGHCPLEYARKDHWKIWKDFLLDKPHLITPRDFAEKILD